MHPFWWRVCSPFHHEDASKGSLAQEEVVNLGQPLRICAATDPSMPSIIVTVWTWTHQGRHEALFLEMAANQRIHFLRRTRSRRLAWGSHGVWRLLWDGSTIRLQLFNFQCCETATLRQVEFYVDPENPRQMVDGSGRTIRYLGVLYMSLYQHERRRALSLSGQEGPGGEWVIL